MKENKKWSLPIYFLAASLFLAVVAYYPGLGGSWNFDDMTQIVDNRAVHPTSWSLQSLYAAAAQSPIKTRPLANISFALDFLRAGLDPRAFRMTNLALHFVAILAAGVFLKKLFQTPPFSASVPWPGPAAAIGALVFGLHPIQAQSVTYIVQRMNVIAGLFSLIALIAWLEKDSIKAGLKGKRAALSIFLLSFFLALAGKENAAVLVLLIAALDRCRFDGDLKQWAIARKNLLAAFTGIFIVASIVFSVYSGGLFKGYAIRDFSMAQRLLTQQRVIIWYVGLWLFPFGSRLSIEHDFTVSAGLFSPPQTIVAGLIIVGLTLFCLVKAHRAPLLCLGWLWFVFGLILESSILPLEMVFEHRLYLPSLGLIMIAAALAGMAGLKRSSLPVLVALIIFLAAGTRARNKTWSDPVLIYRDAVKKAPAGFRSWANLCAMGQRAGRGAESIRYCAAALSKNPGDAMAWYNYGIGLYAAGRYPESESALIKSIELHGSFPSAYYQLGRTRAKAGAYKEAETAYKNAVRLERENPVYWYQLALVLLIQKKNLEGEAALNKACNMSDPATRRSPPIYKRR